MTKKRRIAVAVLCAGIMAIGLTLFLLIYEGILIPNRPSRKTYPVRGVDVSSYQGEIDWTLLASQDIEFAFVKATEGATYTDRCFEANFSGASATGLRVGAYHFFSFDSSGADQAAHFINTVPKIEGMLPPVVDVEFYGDYFDAPADREKVLPELTALLTALEEHYGVKPILYATGKAYDRYLSGQFEENGIWIRDILKKPSLSDGRAWDFWQYSPKGRLDGYDGAEKFIDLNVFCGSEEEFRSYP